MSEALLGVIIGGTIASVGPLINLFFNYYKWRKEVRVEYLKFKHGKLEKHFDEALESLRKCVAEDTYSSDITSDIEILFPDKVKDAFTDMMKDEDQSVANKKRHFFNITFAMKKELHEIEKKIEKELGV